MFLIIGLDEEGSDEIDFSGFSGNLRRDDRDNSRDCWRISDGNNFRVRSKNFVYDKTKVLIFPSCRPHSSSCQECSTIILAVL